ncbi:hypothetical protein ACFLYU_00895 [Candidatus Dependentiae bacterium]
MKRLFGDIKIIAALLACIMCLLGAKRIASYLFSIDGYACTFDSLVSQTHRNQIFNFLNENKRLRNFSLSALSRKISKEFGVIKSIDAFQRGNGILGVTFKTFEPKFILNENYVLAENRAVFAKGVFGLFALERCKCVRLENVDIASWAFGTGVPDTDFSGADLSGTDLSGSCKSMIFSLPESCFLGYEITRVSDTKSYMQDKKNKKFAILFCDLQVPDEKILLACGQIKRNLENKGEFKSRKYKKWVADVRFKDQIVIRKEIRGR